MTRLWVYAESSASDANISHLRINLILGCECDKRRFESYLPRDSGHCLTKLLELAFENPLLFMSRQLLCKMPLNLSARSQRISDRCGSLLFKVATLIVRGGIFRPIS